MQEPNEANPRPIDMTSPPPLTPTPGTGGAASLATHAVPARSSQEPASSAALGEAPASTSPWTKYETTAAGGAAWAEERPMKLFGIGAGTLATLASAVGGVWLVTRWRRERNRPINKLRRGARAVAKNVSGYVPDGQKLARQVAQPEVAGPLGGASTGVLLAALLASRMLKAKEANDVPVDQASRAVRDAIKGMRRNDFRDDLPTGKRLMEMPRLVMSELVEGRGAALRDSVRVRARDIDAAPAKPVGIGIAGLLGLGAAGYLVWRALTRSDRELYQGWHTEATRGETVPNH